MTIIGILKEKWNKRKEQQREQEMQHEKEKAQKLYDAIQRARFNGALVNIDAYTLSYLEEHGFYF